MFAAVRFVHPFLAPNAPVPSTTLIIEGWSGDATLELAITEFKERHYDKLFVTGGPIEMGAPLSKFNSYAELGAAILLKMGLNSNVVQAVPSPWVRQDRTYTSALFLRKWFEARGDTPATINLVSTGPHARRSRLVYQKAFGKRVRVGVLAMPVSDYDPNHWWRSSAGVRTVIGEAIAYVYARFFFWPSD
jgi:hypothetical protein